MSDDIYQRIFICKPDNRICIAEPDGKHMQELMSMTPAEREQHRRIQQLKKTLIKRR